MKAKTVDLHLNFPNFLTRDSDFEESKHPRNHGKFSKGQGASSKSESAIPKRLDELKQVGKQLGSNPGGKYADKHGKEYYVKLSKSPDHAKNEVLAGHLYQAAGAPVIQSQLLDSGKGRLATATPWQPGVKNINPNDPAQRKEAQKHLAAHVWLANWDAAGLEYDNQGIVNGKMTTLDPGGSLIYRAQGGPKGEAFGNTVGKWDTLRSHSNPQAHKVFGEMTPAQLRASTARVAAVPDSLIHKLVKEHGPGTEQQRHALAEKLIARRNDIVQKALAT